MPLPEFCTIEHDVICDQCWKQSGAGELIEQAIIAEYPDWEMQKMWPADHPIWEIYKREMRKHVKGPCLQFAYSDAYMVVCDKHLEEILNELRKEKECVESLPMQDTDQQNLS